MSGVKARRNPAITVERANLSALGKIASRGRCEPNTRNGRSKMTTREQGFKPERDPAKRLCKFCKSPDAPRWDGGMGGMICHANGRMTPITAAQYCCYKCDPYHKWFDLDEEDFESEV